MYYLMFSWHTLVHHYCTAKKRSLEFFAPVIFQPAGLLTVATDCSC